MRTLVWSIRLEGRPTPFLWLRHDGVETAREVERTVADAKARGETVIVGLSSRRGPRPPAREVG